MNVKNNSNFIQLERLFYGLVLLFISPIVGVLASLRNFNFKESKFILFLFFGIFGMSMIIGEGKDAYQHLLLFENSYVGKDFKTFIEETKNIMLLKPADNLGNTNDDPYLHFLSFFTSQITSNSRLLFVIASFIYGYFYVRGISKVYDLVQNKWNFVLMILFLAFIFWKSLEGINSIRIWTGGWIFFNGAFSYFQTKKIKYIFLVLLSPLVHFAYLLIALPFFTVIIFKYRPTIYGAILVISFATSSINIGIIEDILATSDLGAQKTAYINEGSSESYLLEKDKEALYASYYLIASKLFVSILFYFALIFFGYFKKKNHSYLMQRLASLAILLIALSNFATFSIAINNRVFINAGLFALTYLILIYSTYYKTPFAKSKFFVFNSLVWLTLPLLSVFVFTQWSLIGDFTDIRIFVSPLIYSFFEEEAYSLKQLLRELF